MIVFYIYDLPIEQNIFTWYKVPNEKLLRIVEASFLRSPSSLMVFNKLTSVYLSSQYKLPTHKFEYFEILNYGFDVHSPKKTHGFWEIQNSVFSCV
jgi:hypothetical protein